MSHMLKSLAAAAAIIATGHVQATPVVVPIGGYINGIPLVTGTGTLSFSASLVSALNVASVSVSSVDPAVVHEVYQYDPEFEEDVRVSSSATAPIASVTVDDASNEVLAVSTLGGALQTAPKLSGVSLGGTLEVKNLAVDLTNKRIYASLTGNFTGVAAGTAGSAGGAITTVDNFYLWNFASITGPTTLTGTGLQENTISGLSITSEGFKYFVSALRLVSTGVSTLTTVTDYGTITSSIYSGPLTPSTPVPEPSTYAMCLLGIAMVAAVTRARRR